jgi:sugar lactone lactonase YvrE
VKNPICITISIAGVGAALLLGGCEEELKGCSKEPGTICRYFGTGEAGLGDEDLDPRKTELYLPQDLTFTPDGVPYVLDWNNHRVRSVDEAGLAHTVIGTGYLGDAQDGDAVGTALNHPTHISIAPDGGIIIAAWHNSKVMRYDAGSGELTTLCGNGMRSYAGDGGPAKDAVLDLPVATAWGPDGSMYIADQANQRIRRVDPQSMIETYAGNGTAGFAGDGGPATEAQINLPGGQAAPPAGRLDIDKAGNIFFADSANHRIRKIDAGGTITTYAGDGKPTWNGDGGPATAASLSRPSDVALDADGNLFIADTDNACVRKVDTKGNITTAVGICGSPGLGKENELATETLIDRPYGVTFDPDGNLYVADTHNHQILVVWAE